MTAKNTIGCEHHAKAQHASSSSKRKSDTIRILNDKLRTTGCGGNVLITDGVLNKGIVFAKAALEQVSQFQNFSPENDPHEEHDCASLIVAESKIIWKIDYYDKSMTFHSPDPSNTKVTVRVLTIMLAEEY